MDKKTVDRDIRRTLSLAIMHEAGGKAFWVRFRKADGSVREMTCRAVEVKHDNLVVTEVTRGEDGRFADSQTRSINPTRIQELRIGGREICAAP